MEFGVRNELFCAALAVHYAALYPEFDLATDDDDKGLRALLAKSMVWRYEDEFRLVAAELPYKFEGVPVAQGGFVRIPEGSLLAVIAGARMPSENREKIGSMLSSIAPQVQLKEAAVVLDRYELQIRALNTRRGYA